MKSILDKENNRNKCQKFTPLEIVENILDLAGYSNNLMGKRILENSFGSGNIIKCIVRRYIMDAINNNISTNDICKGLENDIFGIELDNNLYQKCITELNEITNEYGIPTVKWSLYNEDALFWDNPVSFQFIVGNPPYIGYKYIDNENREKIRNKYTTCSQGKFDYCYAFIESAINMLADNGVLVQLIPSSIYKNVFANKLRKLLLSHIVTILEYPNKRMFGDTLTSSSIFKFDNKYNDEYLEYTNVTDNLNLKLCKTSLKDKWFFKNIDVSNNNLARFGDFFHASISVATLLNKAFLINGEFLNVEKEIVKKAASPRASKFNRDELIIFPYYYSNGKLIRYSENEFKEKFPRTIIHLNKYKGQLDKRNADSNAKWYEYGRSQALAHLNQDKLLLSTIVTNKVELYKLNAETVPYSGIYIIAKNEKYNLDDAINILSSKEFFEYVMQVGISVSGKSKRITSKDINNFRFKEM